MDITLAERFDCIAGFLNRLGPCIITEWETPLRKTLLPEAIRPLEPVVYGERIASPKDLYLLFKENSEATVILTCDVLSKSKPYIRVLEGAFCSSPDSCELWSVHYGDLPSFVFRGNLIVCTTLTKAEVQAKASLEYIFRDGWFI